jgi:catechol 2,3-dioxygenase-like lactoylglutathione lyase family enzyme
MLDHVGISVPAARLQEVTDWYLAALAPLGYRKLKEFPGFAIGIGPEKYSVPFWIGAKAKEGELAGTHIAFRCSDRSTVDKFHEEALKAGGKCNGSPGLRHQYHDKYYAAFVYDPVG